ncbi:MAG: hypothetical protein ACJAUH_000666 [Saprospiraceae bacterium]|jgi:hypothetical protein
MQVSENLFQFVNYLFYKSIPLQPQNGTFIKIAPFLL